MVGLMQLPLYYLFLFCRYITDQACGQETRQVLPFRRCVTASHTQESSNCKNANVTFIEQDPRKTRALVSRLKGPSTDSLRTLLVLNSNSTTNRSYSPSHTWISHFERKGWEEREKPGEEPQRWVSDWECEVCARREVLLPETFPEFWWGTPISWMLITCCVHSLRAKHLLYTTALGRIC